MIRILKLAGAVRAFLRNDEGTAGLEFVTSVPLLLGVLVFTAEYGQAIRERMALDTAVHDVARYLARAPVDNATIDPSQPAISLYPEIEAEAQALLAQRVEGLLNFNTQVFTLDSENFRDPYFVITVRAQSAVEMPLLSLINIFSDSPSFTDSPNPLFLVFTSEQAVRWSGGAVPGDADCVLADRYKGLCP